MARQAGWYRKQQEAKLASGNRDKPVRAYEKRVSARKTQPAAIAKAVASLAGDFL